MKKTWSIAALFMLLAGCGEDVPNSLADLHRDITDASVTNVAGTKMLIFVLNPSTKLSNASYFFRASTDMNEVLPKLIQYFPEENPDLIFFTLTADLTDQFGNTQKEPVIQLAFKGSDAHKINYKGGGFSGWDLLNLADSVQFLHPAGSTIVSDYCLEKNNQEYARRFCLKHG